MLSIPSIMIEGEELEVVQVLRYLDSIYSADGYLTLEIKKRILNYHRLKSTYTRLAIYNATVLPCGLYA